MKIKTVYAGPVSPQQCPATGKLSLVSDTNKDGPVIIKFDSAEELSSLADRLQSMLQQGHDILNCGLKLDGRDNRIDLNLMGKALLDSIPAGEPDKISKSSKSPLAFQREPPRTVRRPPPPAAIPMKPVIEVPSEIVPEQEQQNQKGEQDGLQSPSQE